MTGESPQGQRRRAGASCGSDRPSCQERRGAGTLGQSRSAPRWWPSRPRAPRVSALAAQGLLSTLYPVGSLGQGAAPRWNGVGGQKAGAGGFLGSRLSASLPLHLSLSLSLGKPHEAGHLGNPPQPCLSRSLPSHGSSPPGSLQGQDWISQGGQESRTKEPAGPAKAAQKGEAEPRPLAGGRGAERGADSGIHPFTH